MTEIRQSATPKGQWLSGDGELPDGVFISSTESYPTIGEAMAAAALKLLDMTDRLEALDRADSPARTEKS